MNKRAKHIIHMLLTFLIALTALYIIIGLYYRGGFPCCTWINGVYCTGKSVAEVNAELSNKFMYDGLKIKDKDGATLTISAGEIGFKADYTDALDEFIANQNVFAWGINAFENMNRKIEPKLSVDTEKLDAKISDWEIFDLNEALDVYIQKTEDGYTLVNELTDYPEREDVIKAVHDSLLNLETEVDLGSEQYAYCYKQMPLNEKQQKTVDLYSKIEDISKCNLVYELGNEKFPIDGKVACSFLLTTDEEQQPAPARDDYYDDEYDEYDCVDDEPEYNPGDDVYISNGVEFRGLNNTTTSDGFVLDQNGNPIICESKLYSFIKKIADDHELTSCLERYKNGENCQIIISKKLYREDLFNVNDEFQYLKGVFMSNANGSEGVRQLVDPETVAIVDGEKDLGGTYIEVNIAEQQLSYYVDGRLDMQFPVVTGNMSIADRATPAGYFKICERMSPKVLKGEDYSTPVDYWLRIYKGVGIHDAKWRSSFGGEIYKTDGSHGCVNSPLNEVSQLWKKVTNGTPVIMYY
ncbi:MAG: L,D-transpeptidase [Butyrivibrio sp.]|nr:L,D-transpeptidase [Butyrivibrio sp.]